MAINSVEHVSHAWDARPEIGENGQGYTFTLFPTGNSGGVTTYIKVRTRVVSHQKCGARMLYVSEISKNGHKNAE